MLPQRQRFHGTPDLLRFRLAVRAVGIVLFLSSPPAIALSQPNLETHKALVPSAAKLHGAVLLPEGAATLAPGCDRGWCDWEITFSRGMCPAVLWVDALTSPVRDLIPAADILVQIRWSEGGGWSRWFPENLLPGGDFHDDDGSGLPDKADILAITTQTLLLSDLRELRLPNGVDRHVSQVSPPLVHQTDGRPVLSVAKPSPAGQVIVQMRSDRFPPAEWLTVSGKNGWDLGGVYTMGLMARFHEINSAGDRLNKIMFIGDDDWHPPGGRSPLRWRAVSFQPQAEARRLNLYAARLISSAGRLDVADYQVRADSLTDPQYRGSTIRRFTFDGMEGWTFQESTRSGLREGVLELRPLPHTNSFAVSPPFDVPTDVMLGFSVEMDVAVPDRYNDFDPSHKAWASTYLELLDDRDQAIDTIKLSVCRPRFGTRLASAGDRPVVSRARLRLVASHQSYLPEEQKATMTGEMIARWRNLEVFACRYPVDWRGRWDERPIPPGVLPASERWQVRAWLLGDSRTAPPILRNIAFRCQDP